MALVILLSIFVASIVVLPLLQNISDFEYTSLYAAEIGLKGGQ